MTFDLGDKICDRGRLFTCVDVEACNYWSPYAAYLEKREAWEVEWVQATVITVAPTFTYTDPLAGFVNGTTEYCGDKSRRYTTYGEEDGTVIDNYYDDSDHGFYITDDRLCTKNEFYARTLQSTLVDK